MLQNCYKKLSWAARPRMAYTHTMSAVLGGLLVGGLLCFVAPGAVLAHGSEDAHLHETIEQHREMARLHTQAAECMASGQSESKCHEELRAACRGLGVGQYCGLRHAH